MYHELIADKSAHQEIKQSVVNFKSSSLMCIKAMLGNYTCLINYRNWKQSTKLPSFRCVVYRKKDRQFMYFTYKRNNLNLKNYNRDVCRPSIIKVLFQYMIWYDATIKDSKDDTAWELIGWSWYCLSMLCVIRELCVIK